MHSQIKPGFPAYLAVSQAGIVPQVKESSILIYCEDARNHRLRHSVGISLKKDIFILAFRFPVYLAVSQAGIALPIIIGMVRVLIIILGSIAQLVRASDS